MFCWDLTNLFNNNDLCTSIGKMKFAENVHRWRRLGVSLIRRQGRRDMAVGGCWGVVWLLVGGLGII